MYNWLVEHFSHGGHLGTFIVLNHATEEGVRQSCEEYFGVEAGEEKVELNIRVVKGDIFYFGSEC